MNKRLFSLDYLRGLAAFGIMIYHYFTWTFGTYDASTFLGRIGVYGVSVFYILSGLTLFHTYYDKMEPSKTEVITFFKKRFFRIFPLLWLVTIASIILLKKSPSPLDLALNLSGLFGFFKWDTYFSTGVWSIGNELVFYVLFPFFILFLKQFKPLLVLLTITLFGFYIYFGFLVLNPTQALGEQWRNYVNPLNQVFIFMSGFLMGYFFQKIKVKNYLVVTILTFSIFCFTFYPAEGNTISIVTGINRLVFTALSFGICFGFYQLAFQLPDFLHQRLSILGEISYSVYLIHPLVYQVIGILMKISNKYLFHFSDSVKLMLSIVITLILSNLVYEYFEKYFMKLGRKI